MNTETHSQLANFIWNICNLLRGPYKRNEYRKVILPLTVLRRFDALLAPTKQAVLKKYREIKTKPETVVRRILEESSGHRFYNLSKMQFIKEGKHSLLDDPNNLAPNLNSYINAFSPNVRAIMERFAFDQQISRMAQKNILFEVVKAFCDPKLDQVGRIDNNQMGYVFEELIRIGAEQANEEAGEHFTPREVIKLMVNLLLAPEEDLARSHVVKTIYDPACGTGGMLSVSENYIRQLNRDAHPKLFGQDWNDDAWAVCKSDMLIKGENADNIVLADTFTQDGFDRDAEGHKWTFDYMLANPPFGVEWKQQKDFIQKEADSLGYAGRFGAGTPRINDGAFLFLQHMISKMRDPEEGGSRIGIVFNGSPLFTGDAGSGESNIRQWIIENDWLEAIVAMPEQLFYNTGIATYVWIVTNRKEPRRKGKIQLIDARNFWVQMEKSLGNKRRRIGDPAEKAKDPDHIAEITRIHTSFIDGDTRRFQLNGKEKELVVSKVFDNEDFGYHKITVERPLRLNFQASIERIARLEEQTAFKNLVTSKKKNESVRQQEIEAGQGRQKTIRDMLAAFAEKHGETLFTDRKKFLKTLREVDRACGVRLSAPERKAILSALCERDETAEICRDSRGKIEPDADLRDTENVPLKEKIETYFQREVLPHIPDAWIDHKKTKVGYEIPLNRNFYRYEPPRPLEVSLEQTAIANFLNHKTKHLDTLIAKKQALIELLKKKRTALISQTVTRGLPSDVAREFGLEPHTRFKDSGIEWLGDVPEGWDAVPLGYLVRISGGATPDKSNTIFWDGDIPWVSPKDMKIRRIRDAQDHVTTHALKNSTLKLLPVDSVLVVVRGMILAHSFPVALSSASLTINQDMKALICLERIKPSFLAWSLEGFAKIFVSFAGESAHGTRKLETETIKHFPFPLPAIPEQAAIATYLDQETAKIDKLIEKIQSAIKRLQEYRTALITAAVTGKIDVRNWTPEKEAA